MDVSTMDLTASRVSRPAFRVAVADHSRRRWFVARPSLTLIGKPSKSLAEKKGAEDAARVAATRQQLGSDGLAAHAERLRVAQAKNAKPVPRQLLKSFEIPSLNHLEWIQTESALARGISQKADRRRFRNSAQDYVNRDGPVPLFIQFDRKSQCFSLDCRLTCFVAQTSLRISSKSPSTSSRPTPTLSSISSFPPSSRCPSLAPMVGPSHMSKSPSPCPATSSGPQFAR